MGLEQRVAAAVAAVAAGRAVVVVGGEDRDDEGDLIFAAERATPELVAFTVRHTSGYLCASLTGADCDRLTLPPMHPADQDRRGTAHRVTVDARDGVTTGISAADRARTMRLLADPGSAAADFTRPGHVVPLRAVPGGVLRRCGSSEAAVDLAVLAGLRPVGVLAGIVSQRDPGGMARGEELCAFATEYGLPLLSIADLVAYRRRVEPQVVPAARAQLPTAHGPFVAVGYDSLYEEVEHIALVCGDLDDGADVLLRIHAECLTGDVLGSLRCSCAARLDAAQAAIAEHGQGVLVYRRGRAGRRRGMLRTLQDYQRRDVRGCTGDQRTADPADTIEDDAAVAHILRDLGVRSVRLLADGSDADGAERGLQQAGIRVLGRHPLNPAPAFGEPSSRSRVPSVTMLPMLTAPSI
ncbi:3,4-dihydroxy-2-butanone-4-phosphate synthase [Pseudonocardia sp. H11422]|uniref:3,4-dihydroxy-2-butanone-4-phosphate synthase n=1 Tax=Pseudonocardia sp. H11422 TaxID=2835866 RepID=UPI001BDCB849|nr:3,4-dihydroxy-2-butanone-4-phosphate synthase [Pseudonocardia sp. H11422]